MRLPLQITFLNSDSSEAIEALIRQHVESLDTARRHITSCRVAVEALHQHHHPGHHYQIRIDVTVPGRELVASHESEEHQASSDINVAIDDAFDSMRRQLEKYESSLRGDEKVHERPPHGKVFELHPESDYGWIKTSDDRMIYFHRNSLIDADFNQLVVGSEVRLSEEMGDNGPQASTVHLFGKHHVIDL